MSVGGKDEGRGEGQRVERAVKNVQALAVRWGHEPWSDSWAELVVKTVLDVAPARDDAPRP